MDTESTLEVYQGRRRVFASAGRWLHPLFELEEFLAQAQCQTEELLVRDKVVGKAAALLLVRLGLRRLRAGILSRLAAAVLDRHRVDYRCRRLVERIDCLSEKLLADVEDPDRAYDLIRERAGRSGPHLRR